MILKSFGCSFIFGSDLSDLANEPITSRKFSNLTWPAVLAQKLNFSYECFARPGSGNLQIAERVLNEIKEKDSSLYVINWTWIDRFDYHTGKNKWQEWETLRPSEDSLVAHMYFKNLHSEYRDKLTSLMFVNTVISKLLQKEINFIMTYEDKLLFDQTWHCSPSIKEMQDYCINHMFTFDGMGFLEWSRNNNYKISNKWHPLDDAHKAAAELVWSQKIAKEQ